MHVAYQDFDCTLPVKYGDVGANSHNQEVDFPRKFLPLFLESR